MYSVIETEEFSEWLAAVKDRSTRIRLNRRLDKARRGTLGDCKPVGESVFEMREFFGPKILSAPTNLLRSFDEKNQHPSVRFG